VAGVLGSSVNFTWAFHGGNIDRVQWGTKHDGSVNIKDVLVSIDKLQTITPIQNPPYSGRVSGIWDGSIPGQATFTLNSIQKADERFYVCQLLPDSLDGQPAYDTVQLLVVGKCTKLKVNNLLTNFSPKLCILFSIYQLKLKDCTDSSFKLRSDSVDAVICCFWEFAVSCFK